MLFVGGIWATDGTPIEAWDESVTLLVRGHCDKCTSAQSNSSWSTSASGFTKGVQEVLTDDVAEGAAVYRPTVYVGGVRDAVKAVSGPLLFLVCVLRRLVNRKPHAVLSACALRAGQDGTPTGDLYVSIYVRLFPVQELLDGRQVFVGKTCHLLKEAAPANHRLALFLLTASLRPPIPSFLRESAVLRAKPKDDSRYDSAKNIDGLLVH
jgi:hypothetical protein